jgi:hypothetical protein
MNVWIEALRLVGAGYLLVLAVLAALNLHRRFLAYPPRVAYALVRLVILGLSFGHIQMTPMARQVQRHNARRIRDVRFRLEEWRDRRAEEQALDAGETLSPPTGWSSTTTAQPIVSAPTTSRFAPPQPAPTPIQPPPLPPTASASAPPLPAPSAFPPPRPGAQPGWLPPSTADDEPVPPRFD